MSKNITSLIGIILMLGGFIGLIACGIAAMVFYFQNPDMTDLRRLIEYPGPSIGAIVCLICEAVGRGILGSNKRY